MHILLPSETQSREFDPKLLLACMLAERGLACVIGSRISMHQNIDRLPRGIYLAKDVRGSSARMFAIFKKLGMRIAALDEEGLLIISPTSYLAQRVKPDVLSQVELFMAWGEAHRSAIAGAPGNHAIVHATGHPRFDLLRPELRSFFAPEADALRQRFGRFVLVNSNFGRANPAVVPTGDAFAGIPRGAGRDEIERYFGFRRVLFPVFAEAIPKLAAALPDTKIVLRPHPAENRDTWRDRCAGYPNVEVIHEGYIVPWLLAADVVVHNGCTTGIEARALDRPCIAYRPIRDDDNDIPLPNDLSQQTYSFEELTEAVRNALRNGSDGQSHGAAGDVNLSHHVTGLDGRLASERMAELLATFADSGVDRPSLAQRLKAQGQATVRRWEKQAKSLIPGHKNSREYTRQRFPGVSLEEARDKIGRFGGILGRFGNVGIRPMGEHLFEVRANA